MNHHKLTYSSGHEQMKGFALTLTVQKASYTLVKSMQETMMRNFGEKIMVRQKQNDNGFTYEHACVGPNVYLIATENRYLNAINAFKHTAKRAFQNGVPGIELLRFLQDIIDGDTNGMPVNCLIFELMIYIIVYFIFI